VLSACLHPPRCQCPLTCLRPRLPQTCRSRRTSPRTSCSRRRRRRTHPCRGIALCSARQHGHARLQRCLCQQSSHMQRRRQIRMDSICPSRKRWSPPVLKLSLVKRMYLCPRAPSPCRLFLRPGQGLLLLQRRRAAT
ncbi:unnamed protein product, partial [Effrenium voratum]